jgi:large subunit ribosomal protein L27
MAHHKGGGSTRNGRDTAGKRLGVKKFGGEAVISGNIIVRQRGTEWHPGKGVGMGVDHTIYSVIEGRVEFRRRDKNKVFVSVFPHGTEDAVSGMTQRGKVGHKAATPMAGKSGAGQAGNGGARTGAHKAAGASVSGAASGKGKAFALLKAPEGGQKDDLGLISGVADKTEHVLNEHGIFHFWQIAAMTDADAEKVEQAIKFHGRIAREEWREQARELMAGKPPRAKVDRDTLAAKH